MKTSIPPSHEHPFAQYVRILGKGKKGTRSLTEQEAYDAMLMIMKGEVLDVQLGAFLMLMRVKEESAEELVGFVKAARHFIDETQRDLKGLQVDLDWSSYAGKRRHLPWYLLAIFALANAGHKIFVHGASGHTIDRIYSEDVLKALGFPIATCDMSAKEQLHNANFCYFPLEHLCPKLHEIIELRNIMGLRSPVHTLSRLLNPCDAAVVMQGIFHPSYRQVHQHAAMALGYNNVAVIKGEAGEIERNPDSQCLEQSVVSNTLVERVWPPMFSKRHVKETQLDTQVIVDVWRQQSTHEYGEAAIVGTIALALLAMKKSSDQKEALMQGKDIWQSRDLDFIKSVQAV
ncbi:MAG: glycosyl transferase family protein [Pseudomonadales bacterium]|nr:glycosyl transferase family protein [Pseudomonadales bacterium]